MTTCAFSSSALNHRSECRREVDESNASLQLLHSGAWDITSSEMRLAFNAQDALGLTLTRPVNQIRIRTLRRDQKNIPSSCRGSQSCVADGRACDFEWQRRRKDSGMSEMVVGRSGLASQLTAADGQEEIKCESAGLYIVEREVFVGTEKQSEAWSTLE